MDSLPNIKKARTEESVRKAETTTIIIPPPEIRQVVHTTALFIANRGGTELEDKIREKEKGNPKFCFLNLGDPYYNYYNAKLKEAQEGKDILIGDNENNSIPENVPKKAQPYEFTSNLPQISTVDLDIVKLTALFVARNGKAFAVQLAQREARNFQFDFLHPNHSLFPFYTKLVEQFTKILLPSKKRLQVIRENKESKFVILDRILSRFEWERFEETHKRKKKEEEEAEKAAYLSVDWNDFILVQTIEFNEVDEKAKLPHPLSIQAIQSMSLMQRKEIMIAAPINNNIGNANEMDMEVFICFLLLD